MKGAYSSIITASGAADWRVKTRPVLEQARAVVVIINKEWITIGKTRFRDADDPVRQELEFLWPGMICSSFPSR